MARNRRNRTTSKISEHFSKKDFVCHCGNCKDSIRLSLGLVGGLELLRTKARNRVNIVKGYVCPDEASKTGSLQRNFHTMGIAADIVVDNTDIRKAFEFAEEIPEFMGIGLDLTKKYIHVDTRKAETRSVWVVEGGSHTDLTPENRSRFLGAPE